MAEVFAVVIFVLMFVLIIVDRIPRHIVTLGCGAATLILVFLICMQSTEAVWETLNIKAVFTLQFWYEKGTGAEGTIGINWATIIFIFGMMVMVEGMAKAGFFRWLCMAIAKAVHYRVMSIFVTFMVMSAVLSMFIDSITVILFLAAVTMELARLLKFRPIPMIIAEIFCANLGGSATMCGDPPNIIVGTGLGYTFADFIRNTGVIAAVCLIFVVCYFCIRFQKEYMAVKVPAGITLPEPREAIGNRRDFIFSCGIFSCAVILLITHARTGLTVAFIGVFIAVLTLAVFAGDAAELLKKVDFRTLLFFVGLFVVVGGLEETGVLEQAAALIGKAGGGDPQVIMMIILWLSAICSAIVDNIPFAATMIPVIRMLSLVTGANLPVLAWALSLGTDLGGSATPIGASANVVGTSVAAREGYPVGWGEYCRTALPATVLVLVVSSVCLILRYF